MNKNFLTVLIVLLLIAGCSNQQSWEEEPITEASDRLLEDDVEAEWQIEPPKNPEQDETVHLKITDKDGKPIDDFEITHEKLLHLIIISKDLSYFNHVHPEFKGNGTFEIQNGFPSGGDYRLIADFKPAEADSMTKMEWKQVEGKSVPPVPIKVDGNLTRSVAGKKVTLTADRLQAGEESFLKFSFTDEKSGQPIDDLEPYLGSIGHVVVLSEDGEQYLHVHAVEGQGSGPEAVFETEFPTNGIYKIWGQFKRDGEVFTVSYVVNVP